jgi:hypothetical protein
MPVTILAIIAFAVVRARSQERAAVLREVALVSAGFVVYFTVRELTEGSFERAAANAEAIIRLQESLGIFVEPTLNHAAASRQWALTGLNWIYIWGHWPVIALVAAWLYHAQPDGYRLIRTAFFISGAIGFFFFALLPTAPPRLMGGEFIDTVTEFSNAYRVLQPASVTNQYAAFPSLHFGWNLLIGIAVMRYARRPVVRVLGLMSPVLMLLATVLTANHYLLDIVMGGIVALAGLGLAVGYRRWRSRERIRPGAGLGAPS